MLGIAIYHNHNIDCRGGTMNGKNMNSNYDKSNDFDIKICNHPTFLNLGCFQSDVALLKFAEPFEFNDNVKKIDIDDNIPSTGESVTVAGKKLCMLFKTVYYNYIDRVPGKSPAHIRESTKILDVIRIMLYEP